MCGKSEGGPVRDKYVLLLVMTVWLDWWVEKS